MAGAPDAGILPILLADAVVGNDERALVYDHDSGQPRIKPVTLATLLAELMLYEGDILRRGASAPEALSVAGVGKILGRSGNGVGYVGGRVLQVAYDLDNDYDSTTTAIPYDNTDPGPTASEGEEFATQTFTPLAADNFIVILAWAMLANSAQGTPTITVFEGTTLRAAGNVYIVSGITVGTMCFVGWVGTAGSTTSRTYSARYGSNTGTCYINGSTSAGVFDADTPKSGMLVLEIAA